MNRNVAPERSEAQSRAGRQALADDLLDQLTSWTPRDREGMFKTWHRGALSLIHLNVVSLLEAEGPQSMSQIAQALDVSDASATGIVDRMERRGLVERQHATDDRRLVLVHITTAGRAVFSTLRETRRLHLSRLLNELTDDELGAILTGLRAMRTAHSRLAEIDAGAGTDDCPVGATADLDRAPTAVSDAARSTA